MTGKNLYKNSIYYLIYNVINVLFPFITSIYAARVLLPVDIGQVAYAQNIVQYFVIFSFLGIPTYGLREIAKVRNDKEKLNRVFTELVIINTISTLLFSVIYFCMILCVPDFSANYKLYFIVGISLLLNFINISWLFEGLEEFGLISIRNIIFKIISLIFLVVFVRDTSDYYIYAIISVFGTAGNYLFNVIVAKKFVHFSFTNINMKQHLKPIMYLVMVNLAIEIYTLVDTTMLGNLCDKTSVAYYNYGSKINKIFLGIINTFTVVTVPRLAFLKKENSELEFNKLITKIFKILLLFSIPCCIGIQYTSDYLICAIFGDVYANSAGVLKILSINLIVSPVAYLLGSRVMLVSGKENQMVYCVGIGAIINVILNYLFIPRYAEIGASIASVVSETAVLVTYLVFSHKFFRLIGVKKFLIKEFIAIIAIVCYLTTCMLLNVNAFTKTIVQVTGAVLVYGLVLMMEKEPTVYSVLEMLKRKGKKS